MENGKPSTPERELLKLIEEDKTQGGISSGRGRKLRGVFSLSAARGRLSFLRSSISVLFQPKEFNIITLNKLLGVIFLFLFLYTVMDITLSMINFKGELASAFKIAKRPDFRSKKEVSYIKGLKYYLNEAKNRDIFNIVVLNKKKDTAEKKSLEDVSKKTGYLKLVGIAWSDNPDAMIEDTHAKRTVFVKEGDLINDILVKKILKDKVVLSLEGKDVELK